MTMEEKVNRLRAIMEHGDPDDHIEPEILENYLDQAGEIILNKVYPFASQREGKEVPDRYSQLQIRIANYFLNKVGAEGEIQHIENGIHRNYGAADVPEAMLKEIVPFVRVIT